MIPFPMIRRFHKFRMRLENGRIGQTRLRAAPRQYIISHKRLKLDANVGNMKSVREEHEDTENEGAAGAGLGQ